MHADNTFYEFAKIVYQYKYQCLTSTINKFVHFKWHSEYIIIVGQPRLELKQHESLLSHTIRRD